MKHTTVEYEPEFDEGRIARASLIMQSSNPYRSQYARTGHTADLWRIVYWDDGWRDEHKAREANSSEPAPR